MSRYKGRSGAKSVERKFPHIVEMAVPLGGFGKRLDDMHEWHRARDIEPRHGRGRHEDECDFIRWCFADPNIAAAFAAAFGGTVQSTTALRGRGNAES
jgi:hypothetical protein